MALDEPKDDDAVYSVNGFTYLIRKTLMERIKPVKVDFSAMGFKISSGMDLGAGCSSCSSGAGCS